MNIFSISTFFLLMLFGQSALFGASTGAEYDSKLYMLSQDAKWLKLLHYSSGYLSVRPHSQEDGEEFFLHANGKFDPHKELLENILYMRYKRAIHGDLYPCRFPARYRWLKEKLGLRELDVACPDLDKFKKTLAIQRVYMVFASTDLNNPSSSFGHTFLELSKLDSPALLNYTLNYGAHVPRGDTGMVYIYRGLTGGYTGRISIEPFFKTLYRHSDLEDRDLLKFQLNLSHEEMDEFMDIIWELRQANFRYYFINENCSYFS